MCRFPQIVSPHDAFRHRQPGRTSPIPTTSRQVVRNRLPYLGNRHASCSRTAHAALVHHARLLPVSSRGTPGHQPRCRSPAHHTRPRSLATCREPQPHRRHAGQSPRTPQLGRYPRSLSLHRRSMTYRPAAHNEPSQKAKPRTKGIRGCALESLSSSRESAAFRRASTCSRRFRLRSRSNPPHRRCPCLVHGEASPRTTRHRSAVPTAAYRTPRLD